MIKYDLDFINKISSTIDIKSLDNSILKILQDIDSEINISFSNENSIYNKKNTKNVMKIVQNIIHLDTTENN